MQCTATDIFLSKWNWMFETNEKSLTTFPFHYEIHLCHHFYHSGSKQDLHQLLFIFQYFQISWETSSFSLLFCIRPHMYNTYESQPSYTSKMLTYPPYSWHLTCLPVNPCSAIPLAAKVFSNCKKSSFEWSSFSSAILHSFSCLHLHCIPSYNNGR